MSTFTLADAVVSVKEEGTDKTVSSIESRVGGMGGTLGKTGLGIGAAIIGGIGAGLVGTAAIALKGGLSRALNIQDARAQLVGLKMDTQTVDQVMQNALASVKGTAFGLDQAATLAATAVAAGVKPGEALERTLRLTADAATIAKVPLSEMGDIYNKVATNGSLTTEVVQQFAQRGVPLLQMVADQYGVTAAEAQKMVTDGKVSFADFEKAIETNIGGAALSSGSTARGAFANIGAAMSRLGAMFLGGGVATAPALFTSIAGAIDRGAVALEPYAGIINDKIVGGMTALAGWIDQIDFGNIVSGLKDGSLFAGGFSTAASSIGTSLTTLRPAFAEFGAQLPKIGGAVAQLASAGLTVLTNVLSFLADNVGTIIQFMPLIVAGFIAWRAASSGVVSASLALRAGELAAAPVYFANNVMRLQSVTIERQLAIAKGQATAATTAGMFATLRSNVATAASTVAMVATRGATLVATGAQWALNAAMSANPIGLLVVAIGALVAGLIWFFTQTELGRTIWSGFVGFLTETWTNIQYLFQVGMTVVASLWQQFWSSDIMQTVISIVGNIQSFIGSGMAIIGNIIKVAMAVVRAVFTGDWSAVRGVVQGAVSSISGHVSGMVGAVRSAIGSVGSIISGIRGTVQGALAGAAGWLTGAGRSIIDGLVSGIRSAIGNVRAILGSVTNLIPDWKGPAERDAILLRPAGGLIMGGLVDGIEDGKKPLRRSLTGITAAIPSMAPVTPIASRGGDTYRIDNVTIDAASLSEVNDIVELFDKIKRTARAGKAA